MLLATAGDEGWRPLKPEWDVGLIAASIAISLLGAFTSTQLMCQARMSTHFSSVFIWTLLGSLTFGFCSIWCLHFVAMLACGLDLPIGINVPLTLLSSILAVLFTFAALASDLLWDRYGRRRRKKKSSRMKKTSASPWDEASKPFLHSPIEEHEAYNDEPRVVVSPDHDFSGDDHANFDVTTPPESPSTLAQPSMATYGEQEAVAKSPRIIQDENLDAGDVEEEESIRDTSSEYSSSRRSSSFMGSNGSSYGLGGLSSIMHLAHRSASPTKNAFIATGETLYAGCTRKNAIKGFMWSLAITSMHYVGIAALVIPNGDFTLEPFLVILSGLISWVVCLVGCILMSQIESHLTQQCLFSVVASTGVAAMHFTGMRAVHFWSIAPPSEERGYPPALAIAIVSIAIVTCMAANFLLAHVATISRNKLAEIVLTRKELWRTIAQKENAEAAAAARSDFIASASHEIRTPLHHLQGYGDLLSRTKLTDEGRVLLFAIQRATKTLSLITNNVLDWSKLESNTETVCRPVSLNMRTVCESVLMLLPTRDDEEKIEIMLVVTPDIPEALFLDETYIHRIIMNLLSNAMKFTGSGYILLLLEWSNGRLVITVKDTGSGIPSSFLPQLFEPFQQAQTRGKQRGTGLGMSIIKQLLNKMQGTIHVESQYTESGIMPDETGSIFTISIPVQQTLSLVEESPSAKATQRIAILPTGNRRVVEGLCLAWSKFDGFDATFVENFCDLFESEWKYVWAELSFLKNYPDYRRRLVKQDRWTILIPYDTPDDLQDIPGLLSTRHFIPLQRPLIWHCFQRRIEIASDPSNRASLVKGVRFAPKVDIMDREEEAQREGEPVAKNLVILLVEDNPINQKLGKRMLASLKYEVLLAEDGEQAIEQIIKHDALIDAILMDQSMPQKDGVTATREIRALEAAGTLSRRRPIIAVTAAVNAQAQALFRSAGTDDFLSKPLSLDTLEQTLARHLRRS